VHIKVKNIKFLLLLIPIFSAFYGFKKEFSAGKTGAIKIIVIDAGHGGKDPGCNGAFAKEKDVSLSVALKLGKLIEQHFKDVKVIYTRTTDVFVELEDRAMIANKAKADLFISVHCNAAGKVVKYRDPKTKKMCVKMRKNKKGKYVPVETTNPLPFGSETYVMGLKNEEGKMRVATRENSVIFLEDDYEKKYEGFDPDSEESYIIMSNYTSSYVIQSANLGIKIQDEYKRKAGRIDKGVHRQSIWVLWRTAMPSILTEIGYLTNPLEEQFLASEKGQDYISKSIFRGLRKYKDELEGNKKEYNDDIENQEPLENENIKAGNLPGQKAKDEDDEAVETESSTKDTTLIKLKDDNKGIVKEDDKTIKKLENQKDFNTGIVRDDAKKTDTTFKKLENQKDFNTGIVRDDAKKTDTTFKKLENQKDFNTGIVRDDGSAETKTVVTHTASVKSPAERTKHIKDSLVKINTRLKFKKDSLAAINTEIEKYNKVKAEIKTEIVFKVQFASSDIELNLKAAKFKAIKDGSFYKAGNVLKYTSGKFAAATDASAHQAELRQNGFADCFVVSFKNGERIDINEAKRLLEQK